MLLGCPEVRAKVGFVLTIHQGLNPVQSGLALTGRAILPTLLKDGRVHCK